MAKLQAREPQPAVGLKVRLGRLLEAATWVALALTIVGFTGASGAWNELCAHFRWQYAICALVAFAIAAWTQRLRLGSVALAVLLLNGHVLLSVRGEPWGAASEDGQRVRLVFANVWADNPSLGAFLTWVRAQQADVVIVAELSPEHAAALEPLTQELPHDLTVPRGVFGIGVWSRHALTSVVTHDLRDDWLCPITDIQFDVRGRPLRIIGAHLFPPLGARGDERNLDQLRGLAEYLGPDTGERVIVAGDFNVTPFAARYRELLAKTRLRSAADGHWPWPTWRPQSWAAKPFAIPIDHVLMRGTELTVVDYEIGPDIGSDHRPVRVDFVTVRKPM